MRRTAFRRLMRAVARMAMFCLIDAAVMPLGFSEVAGDDGRYGDLPQLGRMGAGAPAGWRINGSNFAWEHEPQPGPLGAGAARMVLGDGGNMMIESPPFRMDAERPCAGGVWIRSESPGASVSFSVLDNDGGDEALAKAENATAKWRWLAIEGPVPPNTKGRYFVRLSVSGSDCTVWLDGLWLAERDETGEKAEPPESPCAAVVLEPEAPWGVVAGDGALRVRARVVGVTEPECALRLRAVNTVGTDAALQPMALDTTGFWQGTFEVVGDMEEAYGMVRVEATVVDPTGKPLSPMSETLLARVPEPIPGPMPESYFGVHVSLREPDVAVVSKLGYKWCRIHDASSITKWGKIEPEQGTWVWFDDEVALARQHGLSILGMLCSSPPWESGTEKEGYWSIYTAPKNIDLWRNYVREVVGHYKGSIDEWEVWNEPWDMMRFFYQGTPQLYVELLKAAYEETKAANPDATVVGIDTYPPMWDIATLALGAYPYYDVLSWHRYDPNLHGRSNDAIAKVAKRLEAEQAKYGDPKPLLCSEGGPDVALFHGSFFSFADPKVVGDWSEGTDRYVRMLLSNIAAGNKRFIAYSVHNDPRHGQPTHMLTEPGFLLRPMHAASAALASFVDGAKYEGRLVPAEDIGAHVFSQPLIRPWGDGPSVVVVLHADGYDREPLPLPLPAGLRCFDRWGNPIAPPTYAEQSLVYLVASGDEVVELLATLPGKPVRGFSPEPPASAEDIAEELEPLLQAAVGSLTQQEPPLWTLFSAQASLAVLGTSPEPLCAYRAQLRDDPAVAAQFVLPADVQRTGAGECSRAGEFAVGRQELAAPDGRTWTASFSAVQDGVHGGWRYLTLAVLPNDGESDSDVAAEVAEPLKAWEDAMREGSVDALWRLVLDEPGCFAASTPNGENFLLRRGDYLITMLKTALLWGAASKSEMSFERVTVSGDVAVVSGKWKLVSFAFGMGKPYAFDTILRRTDGGWKLVSLCAGPA